jgi:hypothetical protein
VPLPVNGLAHDIFLSHDQRRHATSDSSQMMHAANGWRPRGRYRRKVGASRAGLLEIAWWPILAGEKNYPLGTHEIGFCCHMFRTTLHTAVRPILLRRPHSSRYRAAAPGRTGHVRLAHSTGCCVSFDHMISRRSKHHWSYSCAS